MNDYNNSNNSNSSRDRNKSKNNRNRPYKGNNRYNKNKKKRSNKKESPQGSDIAVIQHAVKSASNNQNKFNPNNRPRRRSGKKYYNNDRPMSNKKIYSRYNYLIEIHNIARRKYYEGSYLTNERIVFKLRSNYHQTLRDIHSFYTSLNDSQKQVLDQKINMYPEDTEYSSNHNLDPVGTKPIEDYQIKDPHYLPTQKESDFQQDLEESVGSIEDYQKLKGLLA